MAISRARVAVTGGAGFIGAHLCAELVRHPGVGAVTVLDDLSHRASLSLPTDVEVVQGTVLDADAVARLLKGADALVHLAALSSVEDSVRDPVGTFEVNALGSAIVVDAAARAETGVAILASSAAVYGDAQLRPSSPYGASKAAAESFAFASHATTGLPVLVLRLFNVYGPGQSGAAVVPSFVSSARTGRELRIDGDGTQTRDFVYVQDVAALMTDAIVRGVSAPHPVDVGSGVAVSVLELARVIEEVIGRPLRRVHGPARAGDIHESTADVTALRELFPEYRPTSLRDGLAATIG